MSEKKYQPKPEDKFTFGLWTVGNRGADPFGAQVREKLSAPDIVKMLGELGAYGVNFHDNDLVPIDATASEKAQIVSDFKKALRRLQSQSADGNRQSFLRTCFPRRRVYG